MPTNCPSIERPNAATTNVTALIYEQYKDAPKDDWDRLLKCWGIEDCGDCHRSNGSCGWCPIVSRVPPITFPKSAGEAAWIVAKTILLELTAHVVVVLDLPPVA